MSSVATQHLESVVKRLGNLSLAETRKMYAILRTCDTEDTMDDVAIGNAFVPRFGFTVSEIGFAYVVNTSGRGRR